MAEETSVHPGSWLGDSVEEFKKLPVSGKIAVVAGFILVAGIGYYEYSKNKSSSSGVSGSATPSTDTSGGGANQYPTVPGGNTGQVPVLPGGLSPLFDSAGNLIGFEPTPTSTTSTTTGTTTTGGTTTKKKKKKSSSEGSESGKSSGSSTKSHTVKQHQANGSQHKPSVSNSGHSQPKSNNKIQPKNTGGSHGYVYTTMPGDTISSLQGKFFPTSNTSTKQGNIAYYGNNAQIFKQQGLIQKSGTVKIGQQIKPGTKILA